MTERARLLQAVNELEATFRQSFGLGDHDFKDNRKEAIQLRRVISDQMATISAIANLAFDGSAMHTTFRSEFAIMRSTMAFHHASWPVVAIDLENPDYLLSAAKLRETNDGFTVWLKSVLASPR